MDHNSYHQPFNHLQYPSAPAPAPDPADYYYAPASPSDFIYNSANTTSIFRPFRPSRPSCSLVENKLTSTSPSPPAYYPPVPMGYGPSRPVEQSFPTYLPALPEPSVSLPGPSLPEPSLPEPTPGLAEHRRQRQRQTTMNMGPGPSQSVPPPLPLASNRGSNSGGSNFSFSESIVVIKQEEVSSSPVLVSMPMGKVKKWEPRMLHGEQVEIEVMEYTGVEREIKGKGKEMISGSGTWEERGEGVVERVIPPIVPSIGIGTGMGMGTDMGMGMGMGMEPTIMPKMGLFKPIRWDGPSTSSASRSSRSSKAKARRARAWEAFEDGGDVHPQRTYVNRHGNGNKNRNRNNNEETEDEQPSSAPISSSSHTRSPKRLKTSSSGFAFRSNSASTETETETETTITVKIKQEPGLSPSPSAIFAQIPMYSHPSTNNSGYETAGQDGNPPSSRSISPLTRVPMPRRLLFPTSSRASSGTGTNSQLSLRGVSKRLKKRNRQVALDWEESGKQSRKESRERRGEGFWSLAGGGGGGQAQGRNTTAAQDEEIGEWASPRQQQQQQQYRGSSEEKEEGWTTISGSSEEGEVSSHYENSYSYSCGQERDDGAPGNTHQSSPFLPYGDQEWCHPFSSSSAAASPAPVPGSSSSARYGPGSAPSLSSAEQLREEQYRQAIQMVQDTCLEASKRYIRAHCVNRGARGGDSPDTNPAPRETVETRSARKGRRKRKLNQRHASFSSSSSTSSSPSPSPSSRQRQRRRGKGKRQNRTKKRITTTPPSSPSSFQFHDSITCTDSLLPNISQICTLLWSRSQSLRLHDIDSIELHTARNMYWLLSWAETVAFAVPPTVSIPDPDSTTSGRTSVGSSFPGFGVSSLENLAASGRGQWTRPSSSFSRRYRDRYRDPDPSWGVEHAISPWENLGEGLNEEGYMWRRRNSEEGGGFEMLESRNGAVWEQQREEMKRVFDEGGMLCEFLGYGEGVERLGRVRGFYGF